MDHNEFIAGIVNNVWNWDLEKFKEVTGFVGDYAMKKFHQFSELSVALAKFDKETIEKLATRQ